MHTNHCARPGRKRIARAALDGSAFRHTESCERTCALLQRVCGNATQARTIFLYSVWCRKLLQALDLAGLHSQICLIMVILAAQFQAGLNHCAVAARYPEWPRLASSRHRRPTAPAAAGRTSDVRSFYRSPSFPSWRFGTLPKGVLSVPKTSRKRCNDAYTFCLEQQEVYVHHSRSSPPTRHHRTTIDIESSLSSS